MRAAETKKSVFHMVPVDSRQITMVVYDVQSKELFVHYHSGEVRLYAFVSKEEYDNLRDAANRYDELMDMTHGRGYEFVEAQSEKEPIYH